MTDLSPLDRLVEKWRVREDSMYGQMWFRAVDELEAALSTIRAEEPIWAAAARAYAEGKLDVPPRAMTIRAEEEPDLRCAFCGAPLHRDASGLPAICPRNLA